MLKNRIMVSMPTENPKAYRQALKLVASNHGKNIGKLINEILMASEYGDEFKAAFAKFVAESGNNKIQSDTIVDSSEGYDYE